MSLEQLRGAGLGDGAIKWRCRQGRLHRVHRGVYAVGYARLTERGHMWAATLAVPNGALSHWTAAAVWDLARLPSGPLHVTTSGQSRSTKELKVHRKRSETTQRDGLEVTTVAQTLRDLALTTSRHRLERLVARAEHLRLLDTTALTSPTGRRGAARLRQALSATAQRPEEITRSHLEELFLEAVARAGLPRPEVNRRIEDLEVDFLWRAQRLVVETDGAATHLTPRAFAEDRRRDQHLTIAGWRVLRFTYGQVADGSAVTTLRRLLL